MNELVRCQEPGCSGTVVDGYCELCGMAPAPAARATPAAPAAQPEPTNEQAGLSRCQEPGCSGTVVDGYCELCGIAASAAPAPAEPAAAAPSTSVRSEHTERSPSGRVITARSRRTSGSRRGALGAGLVEVPAVPAKDPAEAILDNPEVPERHRFCSNCGDPVGRGGDGAAGRTKGFCRKCGHQFDFRPKLGPGDLVGGQYDVLGCLAHGGLGWIYLARDLNVSNRWVVLKGLLNAGDTEAQAAAAAERAFLAEVEHPNIVKIYNFVQHTADGQQTGYIVMEYVGGRSLRDLLLDMRKTDDQTSMPVGQAIAYMLEVLRAMGYLHGKGLLFCDFKPDNAIQSEEQLKVIDLGGVLRIDDPDSAIYGSVGYQAPEIASQGPSISSDLYTVGRALAVLTFPFKGYTNTYAESLPPREDVPLLRTFDSFDRLLRRATHQEPAARFQDADEMAAQLTSILREALAAGDGEARPAPSTLFGPEFEPAGTDIPWEHDGGPVLGALAPRAAATSLPTPLIIGTDPAAAMLASLTGTSPEETLAALSQSPSQTVETKMMMVRVRIDLGDLAGAVTLLDELDASTPGDWRVDWYRALVDLAGADLVSARQRFDELYSAFPGEACTKLGLANACECAGDLATAAGLYETVWRTDNAHVSAVFGLARARIAQDDRRGAIAALDSVPKLSSRYVSAQVATVVAAVRGRSAEQLTVDDLLDAGQRLVALDLPAERRNTLAAEVLGAGLRHLAAAGNTPADDATLLGAPLTERGLRKALDGAYRSLAHICDDRQARHDLVDRANSVRPKTWV